MFTTRFTIRQIFQHYVFIYLTKIYYYPLYKLINNNNFQKFYNKSKKL